MRFFFYVLLFGALFIVLQRFFGLLLQGKIFDAKAIRDSFSQLGKDVWLGARLFVILWFCYLIFIWLVRHNG